MSDFFQHGMISTLHRLIDGPIRDLERTTGRARSTVLVLPCHFSEIGAPALRTIIERLNHSDFLSEVVISMNGVTREQLEVAVQFWKELRLRHAILWNDSPALLKGLALNYIGFTPGKGLNIWLAFGWLAINRDYRTVILHDCDILNYDLDLPLTLALPTCTLGYDFTKGYYSRVREELFGRVTRLFVIPLVRSLIRVLGHMPMLDFIDSFRYPLSGECSMRMETALNLPVESGWALEIGWLCDLHRLVDPGSICQVDLAIQYDHKHQKLETLESRTGLLRMASDIGWSLLTQLEREGASLEKSTLDALLEAYEVGAKDFIRRYGDVAKLNGLPFDENQEIQTVAAFQMALEVQCAEFLAGSRSEPLPPWRLILGSDRVPEFAVFDDQENENVLLNPDG
jgi:glucosyl-3-phosphoglycerate synthase